MITSRRSRSPVVIVGFILSCLASVCIMVGFVGNGIDRRGDNRYSVDIGIWYATTCTESEGCESISRKEQYDNGVIDDLDYVTVVDRQVIVTLSGFFIVLVDLIYLLQLVGIVETGRASPPIILLCVAIGTWLLLLVEYPGGRQIIDVLDDNNSMRLFPWSLFFLGVGCVVSLVLAIVNYIQSVRVQRFQLKVTERKASALDILEMLISFLCLALHLCGHGSNAISIQHYNEDQGMAPNVTMDTSKFISEEKRGIWYISYCYFNGHCETASRIEFNNMINPDSEYIRVLINFQTVSTMVFTTIATLSTIVVVLLYCIGLSTDKVANIKLHLMTFSMVSGCLLLYFTASEARWQVMANDAEFASTYQTMIFPWGLLVLGISSILSFFLAGVNLIKLLFCSRNDTGSHVYQEDEFITMNPAISTKILE